jgi:hypothetical protein
MHEYKGEVAEVHLLLSLLAKAPSKRRADDRDRIR